MNFADLKEQIAFAANPLSRNERPALQEGNRCYHDKENPNFKMIEIAAKEYEEKRKTDEIGKRLRPLILRKAADSLKELYQNPEKHWMLTMLKSKDMIKCRGANLKKRKSSGREADIRALGVMLLHMDLCTMMLGYRDQFNNFCHYSWDWLAQQAGMSISRFQRALHWWRSKGFALSRGGKHGTEKICIKNDDGTFSGRACPKRISVHLFDYFSMGEWLTKERKKASARLRMKQDEGIQLHAKREKAVAHAQRDRVFDEMRDALKGKKTGDDKIDNARSAGDILKFLS